MRMMMYRPYTTIGTNKKIKQGKRLNYLKIFFTVCWFLAMTVSRAGYLLWGGKDVAVDAYGLFARSMVRMEGASPGLDSGLTYAYTKSLSRLLKFFGNRIEAVVTYQVVLQILWLALLFAGIALLFGYVAGAAAGSVLALSPWLLESVLFVWPGNYYMLHFALALVLLGISGCRTGKERWFSNAFGRLLLAGTGFYVGVLCIWNALGILLAFVMIYLFLRNHFSSGKRKLSEEKAEDAAKPQGMKAKTQAALLAEGILIGIFATLMKYAGVTGKAIAGQAMWWLSQLKDPLAQYREMQVPLICWLFGAVGAGILCQILVDLSLNKKAKQEMPGAKQKAAGYGKDTGREMAVQGEIGRYIITEDGRRIKLLDNPLPGPKKHIKREMDFDLDFEKEAKDDFDIRIEDGDDFDI